MCPLLEGFSASTVMEPNRPDWTETCKTSRVDLVWRAWLFVERIRPKTRVKSQTGVHSGTGTGNGGLWGGFCLTLYGSEKRKFIILCGN